MAKRKGTADSGSNDKSSTKAADVAASNKQVLEQLNEISNQSANFFNVAREAALKFIGTAGELSNVLSEQCEKVKCFEAMSKSLESAEESSNQFTAVISKQAIAVKKLAENAGFKKSGSGYAAKNNVFEQLSESSKRAKIGVLALGGAIKLLGAGFSLVKGIISTIGSVVGKLIGLVVSAGKAIFNFVVGIYETMFDMANDYIQLILALQREKENIRESFGDTSKSVGKAVVDMGNQLFAGGAAGLAGMQLFESGVEAMVAAHELAKAGGAAFEKIIGQFSGTGINNIYAFQHGLGLTNEELGKMMSLSVTEDKQLEGMLANVEKYARGMSSAFGKTGGSFKSISRDMVKAKIDVKNFANVSDKDLAVAAQSARSLGVELDKLTGILDAFDQFDSAAENVSKLSQAFGLNLDTMQLMNASTPTEQIDIIKRSFAAAGKSVENLDKRSLNYLATTLHLDPALVQQTMSTKNQGAAMGDLKTKAASVESQMISTTDALKDVMKDIKLFIREMTNDSKGFFATFFEGFTEGIVMNQRFKSSMTSMAEAIIAVKLAGRQAGDAFVEYFPGIKEMLEGLKTVMPIIGKLFQQYSKSISDFFKALREGGPSVSSLFGKLKGDTKKFFQEAGPGGRMFADGATSFLSTVGRIFQEAVAALINSMTDMLEAVLIKFGNWLEEDPSKKAKQGGERVGMVFMDGMWKKIKESPIGQAFNDMGKRLGPPMEKIINLLGEKIKTYFENNKVGIAKAIAGVLVLAIGGILFSSLPMMLVGAIKRAFEGGGAGAASNGIASAVSTVVERGATTGVTTGMASLGRTAGTSITTSSAGTLSHAMESALAPNASSAGVMLESEGVSIATTAGRNATTAFATTESKVLGEAAKIGGKSGMFSKAFSVLGYGKGGLTVAEKVVAGQITSGTAKIGIKAATALGTGLKGLGAGLKGVVSGWGGLAAQATLGVAESYYDAIGNYRTAAVANLGSATLTGASIGGLVGSVIPVAGTALGAGIGASLGLVYKFADSSFRTKLIDGKVTGQNNMSKNFTSDVQEFLDVTSLEDKLAATLLNETSTREQHISAAKNTKEAAASIIDAQKDIYTEITDAITDLPLAEAAYNNSVGKAMSTMSKAASSTSFAAFANVIKMKQDADAEVLKKQAKGDPERVEKFRFLQHAILNGTSYGAMNIDSMRKLFSENETERAEHLALLMNEIGNDDEMKASVYLALTTHRLQQANRDADEVRKARGQAGEQEAIADKAIADKQEKDAEIEGILGRLGFGSETVKMDVISLENRLNDINTLNKKITGPGPLNAKTIDATIAEMRTALSGITWSIVDPTVADGMKSAFDSMRMLRGILTMLDGFDDGAVRAANSLKRFGKIDKAGSPAQILYANSSQLSQVVKAMAEAFTGIETITTTWENEFLAMSLTEVAAKVDELATSSAKIAKSIKRYTDEVMGVNTDAMKLAARVLIDNMAEFRTEIDNVLKDEQSTLKVDLTGNGGVLSGKYLHVVQTVPLNLTVQVDVSMKTDDIEKMILSQTKSIFLDGLNDVAKQGAIAATAIHHGGAIIVTPTK